MIINSNAIYVLADLGEIAKIMHDGTFSWAFKYARSGRLGVSDDGTFLIIVDAAFGSNRVYKIFEPTGLVSSYRDTLINPTAPYVYLSMSNNLCLLT